METVELEDLVYTYPEYDVNNFQTLISAKEEFKEVAAATKETTPKRGDLFKHQKFIKRLMIQYDNQLITHSTGSGKTCSVIAVSEHYKAILDSLEEIRTRAPSPDIPNPPFKRAYILVKGENLANEFKFQIMCKCTPGTYITEQIVNSKTETARKGNVTRSLARFYTVKTYGVFTKKLLKMTDEQLHNEFDNCIFIVDEVHNINENLSGVARQNKISGATYYVKMKKNKKTGMIVEKIIESRLIYDQLWRLFHTVTPRKTMLLSATPMINSPSEIAPRLNLILPADRQIPRDINWKTVGIDTLEPYFRGLISYVRALDTGAIPVYQGKVLDAKLPMEIETEEIIEEEEIDEEEIEEEEEEEGDLMEAIEKRKKEKIEALAQVEKKETVKAQTVIYGTKMLDKQLEVYQRTVSDPGAFRPKSEKPEAFDDLERQAANFVFPDGSIGSEGYNKYVIEDRNTFKATPELKEWISDPETLRELSSKFFEIIRLCKNEPGNCWCYIDYIRGSGAIVLGLCFEALGFERFTRTTSAFSTSGANKLAPICGGKSLDDVDLEKNKYLKIDKRLRFGLLTSATSSAEAAVLLELFNSYENRHGEYIKALIGSPVTRDGLNLGNGIQIHLTGGGWNRASSYQAISRAIRSTSHVDLIEEEKERLRARGENPDNANVIIKIYQHAALDENNTSIDTKMYALSEIKDRQIKRVIRMMKQAATDCQINYNRNVRPKDVDGSAVCDYDICKYKCFDPIPDYTDYTSYDVLYSGNVVDAIKSEIADFFRVLFRISYDTLYTELIGYRKKFINIAVSDLIEKRTPIVNRYGKINYLREDRGTIFLRSDFPLNINEKEGGVTVSEYSSSLLGIKTLTLNEYNGMLQRGKKESILDILEGLTPEEFSEKIDNLTLENKILLLESAISSYYISGIKNEIIEGIILKFRSFIFFTFDPIEALKLSMQAFAKRGKGRGRKPKEGTKFKLSEKQTEEIETSLGKLLKGEVTYFHNLSISSKVKTTHGMTAKSRKISGKIRLLKESENVGWRDAIEQEEIVYNLIIKGKLEEEEVEFDIYGIIYEDNKFRIVDKTKEEAGAKKDIRKAKRGRECSSWRRKDLVDLMWKLRFNPFNISIEFNRDKLINYMVKQDIATKNEAKKFEDERLNFYFTWYTSGISIAKICELLQEYFEEIGRLIRS
jgi:Type III restriction enzyme, res subunit